MMLLVAGDAEPTVDLTPDEEAAVMASKAAATRNEFASDEQIQMTWAKHGL